MHRDVGERVVIQPGPLELPVVEREAERLDEVQAAILRVRLPLLRAWTERRRQLASLYRRKLELAPVTVLAERDAGHVYHLFVVRSRARRDLQAHLLSRGVETLIHFPMPIPRQPALAAASPAYCPIAAAACDEVLSLPLRPGMADSDVEDVAAAVGAFGPRSVSL